MNGDPLGLSTSAKGQGGDFVEYCEIKEFGYALRDKLIAKWHSLGREFSVDESELAHEIATSAYLVDTLITKGMMPCFPVFVLGVLQESRIPSAVTASHGSYGHIYNSLITSRLMKAARTSADIGMWYAYLAVVAHSIFRSGNSGLSVYALRVVHQEYCTLFGRNLDFGKTMEDLLAAHILTRDGDEYAFKYGYYYYFFIAKYYQDAIGNDPNPQAVRAELQSLADMVSFDDYCKIVLFYVYLTKDRLVIEHLQANSNAIFARVPMANFTTDTCLADGCSTQPLELEEPPEDTRVNREEYLKAMDLAQEELDSARDAEALDRRVRYSDTLDLAVRLDFAMNSITIMGQVLRNFPGDLRADIKVTLAGSIFELGLRTTREVFNVMDANVAELRKGFIEMLRSKKAYKSQSEAQLRESADTILFALKIVAAYGMVKTISSATGLEDLVSPRS